MFLEMEPTGSTEWRDYLKKKKSQPLKISLFNFLITELSYNNCVAWEERSNDILSICCFSPKFSRINCNKYLDNSIIVGGQIELFKLFLHYPRPSKINSNKCLVTFLYFKAGFFWDFLGLSWVRIFNYHSVFSLSKCFLGIFIQLTSNSFLLSEVIWLLYLRFFDFNLKLKKRCS